MEAGHLLQAARVSVRPDVEADRIVQSPWWRLPREDVPGHDGSFRSW